MGAPLPDRVPTATLARTREDGYQLLRMFVLASGAEESDGTLDILPGPCGGDMDPRQRAAGYYRLLVLGGFRALGDDQHGAFAGMHAFVRRNRFRIRSYRNPDTSALRPDAVGQWELKGVADVRGGFAFSVFTVRPQTHVAVWITSTCRRTPERDEPDGPFTLPSLVPHVPTAAPVWAPRPSAAPTNRSTATPPAATGTRTPDAGPSTHFRDLLG
ncbi:hypothetical protein [Yinghuangia sp. YIM S09857]|uniref:hypothetical protein n=1 Tax=Yinghuangia sp. YIM S09857 TaxID=3436929 RepID=UPI003F53B834